MRRGLFPLNADVGKKAIARGARFSQHLITAISVVTDGGCGKEHARWIGQITERIRQQLRSPRAALTNSFFLLVGPTSFGNAFAGEMHDRIETFN
jgi:hypothetical protein